MAAELGVDELVVNTITWDHEARLRSYALLARVYDLAWDRTPAESPRVAGIRPVVTVTAQAS